VNPDLRNLIALQDLELKIAFLRKQIAEVPVKIQSFQNELQQLQAAQQERNVRLQELGKQRRALEGSVEVMRTKLSKLRDQLMSVKTNKEYTAMLHEIQTAEEQIRAEEDKVLEVMEQMESMELELKDKTGDMNKHTSLLQEEIRQSEASVPGLEAELAKRRQEQAAMESLIESELLSRYRRIADARKGLALAEAKDELCSACHVRIRPQVFADILRTEDIYACDSCSRILFSREVL
jgi:predicted  nucleic acid-binding Zn-ribbon protein